MISAAYLQSPMRQLSFSGEITYLTGASLPFSGEQALSFSISEGAGEGVLLGGAFSASFSLSLYDRDDCFTFPHSPKGAQVRLFLEGNGEKSPLGVFTVTRVFRDDRSKRLTLSGLDALGTAFESAFSDSFSYPVSLKDLASGMAAQAGFSFAGEIPNGDILIASPPAWGEISLRQALSYAAEAAGCFAALSREGMLRFFPAWPQKISHDILPDTVLKGEWGEMVFGPLEGIAVRCHQAPRDASPLVLPKDGALLDAQNSLILSGNPLFSESGAHTSLLAQGVLNQLRGMKISQGKISWRGNPSLTLGDRVKIWDQEGNSREMQITGQTLSFSQGFSMQSDCRSKGKQESVGKLFTASGALNAAMLSGELDGVLIRDGSIAARSLLAGSITALQLAADSVTADQLSARSVTAQKLAAQAVEAEHLSAAALNAVNAQLKTAEIGWAEIDELTAVIASIASGKIQNADIDFAHIKDLTAGTAIITQGVGGELYISRLAVTEANMVSLSVGQLLVKGQDGGFYALSVDASGNVTTQRKQVGNDDIGNLSINAGEKLIEGSVTAATLNVQNIFADSAIIRYLMAANMDVDTLFAREATIEAINALDIRGNQYLKLSVDALRQEIEASASDATGQQMTISFSQGNAIEEERKSITASVHIWKNGEEITDQIPAPAFFWVMEGGREGTWYGVKEVTLSREQIGKSCQLRCILDEAGSFGTFEIVDGELILTRPDTGVTDAFYLSDGNLYGEDHYSLENGTLTRNAASNKMQVTTSVFDHSILETSHILIKDNAIDIRSGGNINIAAGGTLNMAASALKLTATTTLDDELKNNAQAASNAQSAANAAQDDVNATKERVTALEMENGEFAVKILDVEAKANETPSKVVNTAMTLDANGIEMNTSGAFRLYANDGKNSRIKLGGDDSSANFSVDESGAMGAVSGDFAHGLSVGNYPVWTKQNIIISSNEPTGVHDVLWIQPLQGVQQTTHSVLNTSQTHFTSGNALSYTLAPESADVLASGGSYSYSLSLRLTLGLDTTTPKNYTVSAVISTSAGSVALTGQSVSLTGWKTVQVTLTATSSVNLCASSGNITAAVTVSGGGGGNTNMYIPRNTSLILNSKNTAASSAGAQTCSIHYIP